MLAADVPNALSALVTLLASLHDKAGKVTVEGFYDGVPEITPSMRAEVVEMNHDEEAVRMSLGLDALYGEEGYSFIERIGVRPTLDFNGVNGGFQGEGLKTVIPREAHAKISCRLVGEQDPQEIINKITRHLEDSVQPGAKLFVKTGFQVPAFSLDPWNVFLQLAADAYEEVYGH